MEEVRTGVKLILRLITTHVSERGKDGRDGWNRYEVDILNYLMHVCVIFIFG